MKTLKTKMLGKILKLVIVVFMILSFQQLRADQIDIGIFVSGPSSMEIRMKPDFTITPGQFIEEIRFTLRYQDDPAIDITVLNLIPPFNVDYDGPAVVDAGFKYQTFSVQPFLVTFGSTINAGEEVVISSFLYSGGPSALFVMSDDSFTLNNNLEYYFGIACGEVNGPCTFVGEPLDLTGIIYASYATIPVSNWAVLSGLVLIMTFLAIRFRKLI